MKEFLCGGFGVAFDGELEVRCAREGSVDGVEQAAPEGQGEEGRRAAADEDGGEPGIPVGPWGDGAEFGLERVDECLLLVTGVDEGVKIAVVALVEAEGDVDVEGSGAGVGRKSGKNRSLLHDVGELLLRQKRIDDS